MSKKLIECKRCGAEISKNADICPKWGAKNKSLLKKPKFYFSLILLIIVLSIITYMVYPICSEYIGNTINGKTNLLIENNNISYNQLMKEYETDRNGFNLEYTNKSISFTDEVVNIQNKTINGNALIFIKFKSDILLTIVYDDIDIVSNINKGDKLYIEGIIDGAGNFEDLRTDQYLNNGCIAVTIEKTTSENIKIVE